MALQKLKYIRRPLLTSIASMDDVLADLIKEVKDAGYTVEDTEIIYDSNARQCTIQILAEKRGMGF